MRDECRIYTRLGQFLTYRTFNLVIFYFLVDSMNKQRTFSLWSGYKNVKCLGRATTDRAN